ncbi:hypothetical protein DFJ73DRAFT_839876 [Zopfochytrium polystomum]|nr:hypothetical protein DFJ73DRAFT_839876 [Zopfochytrium polystomum]
MMLGEVLFRLVLSLIRQVSFLSLSNLYRRDPFLLCGYLYCLPCLSHLFSRLSLFSLSPCASLSFPCNLPKTS